MATKAKTSTEDWIEELKSISVVELSERIKALEEEFGVSATAEVGIVRADENGPNMRSTLSTVARRSIWLTAVSARLWLSYSLRTTWRPRRPPASLISLTQVW